MSKMKSNNVSPERNIKFRNPKIQKVNDRCSTFISDYNF